MSSEQDSETGRWVPPIHVSLRFCSVCGRDNRAQQRALSAGSGRHRDPSGSKWCPGKVETLRYDFAE